MSLSCSFTSDPVSDISWSWANTVITNTSVHTIREYGHSGTKTSVLDMVNIGPDQRGVYTCTAVNIGGVASDTKTLVVIDHDIYEQLVKLKLYVMAGVGGCIVLLSSFIAASCIYTARRQEAYNQVIVKQKQY